jgi:transketolase
VGVIESPGVEQPQTLTLDARSRGIRRIIIDALEGGGRGHVGSALSLVEIMRVFYDDILNVRPSEPQWPQRDRLILSKGHGCLALYALLAEKGFFEKSEMLRQCRTGALLGGHPEHHIPGVEASTGSLGHGLSIGVGIALALRMRRENARVFVVCGDGELGEGAVWEAALGASKHGLDRLTVVIDYNKLQCYGPIRDVLPLEPLVEKWQAFGFSVREVDGHDVGALHATLSAIPIRDGRPSVVIAHTIKGAGIDFAEHNAAWHHKSSVKPDDVAKLREALERHP